MRCSVLQDVLQCVAVCRIVLQCVAVCCSARDTPFWPLTARSQGHMLRRYNGVDVHCIVLKCVAVCCSVLQCVAVCTPFHVRHSKLSRTHAKTP